MNGRKIKGGGGIQPDIDSKKDRMPGFIQSLWANERLFVLFGAEYSKELQMMLLLYTKIFKE